MRKAVVASPSFTACASLPNDIRFRAITKLPEHQHIVIEAWKPLKQALGSSR
jgi:hypothetical protein